MEFINIRVSANDNLSAFERAKAISKALFNLAVPNTAGRVSTEFGIVIEHPTTGEVILKLPNKPLNIHPEADVTILDNLLSPPATQTELDVIHYVLNVCKSGGSPEDSEENIPANRIDFTQFLPDSFQVSIKSETDLTNEGWYAAEVV